MAFINGREYDHSSHVIRINGNVAVGVKEISYSHGREGESKLYGTSKVPIARTEGHYKPEDISLTLFQSEYSDLISSLGRAYMQASFPIVVERSEALNVETDDLISCKIMKEEHSSSEGGEAKMIKLTLSCMGVIHNGIDPMDETINPAA